MGLNNIKTKANAKGFTIVELLIVIVVIGILAAITIVAYNGIQNRARQSSAQSAATTVMKKAEAYNAIEGSYPADLAAFNAVKESELTGSGVTLGTPTAATGTSTVLYARCGTTGAQVTHWNYNGGAIGAAPQFKAGTC